MVFPDIHKGDVATRSIRSPREAGSPYFSDVLTLPKLVESLVEMIASAMPAAIRTTELVLTTAEKNWRHRRLTPRLAHRFDRSAMQRRDRSYRSGHFSSRRFPSRFPWRRSAPSIASAMVALRRR